MNIVIYARFSSHAQSEQSIEGQLNVCYEYASRLGYAVIGEYIDRAMSATTDNRAEFQRMIEDSGKKHFQAVLVYQLDRFSRNRYDSAIYKARLKKNGARVISARENISDDASGVLMEAVLEGMAEYYSRELSQKVKRGMKITASKCQSTGTRIALGYKVGEDKKFYIDDPSAAVVKEIYELYASGKTIAETVACLNSRQLKTSSGGAFNKNSLRTILGNKKYIGVYTYDDIEISGGVPRILSDELFYKVQGIMEANKKAPARARAKEEYILTTKLFCGHCWDMMIGVSGTSKTGKKYHYYACNNARRKLCNKKQVNKQWIEDYVIRKCIEILTDENIELIAKAVVAAAEKDRDNSRLKFLEKQLKDNERKQTNLTAAVAECGDEGMRKSFYEELTKLRTARSELEKELAAEDVGLVRLTIPQIKFFLSQLKKGSVSDMKYRKTLVAVLVNAIYLYDDKVTFVLNAGDKQVEITEQLLGDIEAECSPIDCSGSPTLYTNTKSP